MPKRVSLYEKPLRRLSPWEHSMTIAGHRRRIQSMGMNLASTDPLPRWWELPQETAERPLSPKLSPKKLNVPSKVDCHWKPRQAESEVQVRRRGCHPCPISRSVPCLATAM